MASATLLPRILATLYQRHEWTDATEIATALGTSASAVHPWWQALLFQRAVRPDGRGYVVDRDRLLRYFTAVRMAAHRPTPPFQVAADVATIHERLSEKGVPFAFGFFTAANLYAFFEPRREVYLYAARGSATKIRSALGGRLGLDGATVLRVFEEPLDGIAQITRTGLPITSPLQTVVDLRAHPEGGAHADFLMRAFLPRLREDG